MMENNTRTNVTVNEVNKGFENGKVFQAILSIMENLNVPKNGTELDENGELKYRYIQIADLREALKPLLIANKVSIRKIGSKNFRDRKQTPRGFWVNVDVVENNYMLQSLEDGSFIIGTGRGEGSDFGSSAVTLAEADAFKNFVGTTFCLVTDDESESDNQVSYSEPVEAQAKTEVKKKPKKVTKKEEPKNKDINETVPAIKPIVNVEIKEPENEVLNEVQDGVTLKEGGEVVSLSQKAVEENQAMTKPVPIENKEPMEKKEEAPKEPVEEKEPEEEKPPVEATEEQISFSEEIKPFIDIECPVKGNDVVKDLNFGELLNLALSQDENSVVAKNCIIFLSSEPEAWKKKAPEFTKACKLAQAHYNLCA